MFINEYGSREDPTIILLAPMMVSGTNLYDLMRPYWKGAYHVIAPDHVGHGKAGAYISADEEYQALRSFLLENDCREIALVYGASLGVAVAYRIFFDPAFHIRCGAGGECGLCGIVYEEAVPEPEKEAGKDPDGSVREPGEDVRI